MREWGTEKVKWLAQDVTASKWWSWDLNPTNMAPQSPQSNLLHYITVLAFLFSCAVVSDSLWPHGLAHQAPLSMGFPRQEHWSGLPLPSPEDPPNPGTEHKSLALAGGFHWTTRKALYYNVRIVTFSGLVSLLFELNILWITTKLFSLRRSSSLGIKLLWFIYWTIYLQEVNSYFYHQLCEMERNVEIMTPSFYKLRN